MPYELTGIHAHYDMRHELGRGTFATVMKAMLRTTGDWWQLRSYIIHLQKLCGFRPTRRQTTKIITMPLLVKIVAI